MISTIAIALVALTLTACGPGGGGSGGGSGSGPHTGPPQTGAPHGSSTPTGPTQTATGKPASTTLKPCDLVTSAEASQLAGTTFGKGVVSSNDGANNVCVYGGNTKNVFEVLVGRAPDAASAKSELSQVAAQFAQSAGEGIKSTTDALTGVGDWAEFISFSSDSLGVHASAIFLIKGTIIVDISDLVSDAPSPAEAPLVAEAKVVVSRLP